MAEDTIGGMLDNARDPDQGRYVVSILAHRNAAVALIRNVGDVAAPTVMLDASVNEAMASLARFATRDGGGDAAPARAGRSARAGAAVLNRQYAAAQPSARLSLPAT